MAYSVNWLTKVITIPQADLLPLGGSLYQLNVDDFRKEMRRLEWTQTEGLYAPQTVTWVSSVTLGGTPYAALLEVINGYTITFEDGQYAVNVLGANSNIGDVVNVNQVSVRPQNSAGLINLDVLLSSAYQGVVIVDQAFGQAGSVSPIGTSRFPCNNFDDAYTIANTNGVPAIQTRGPATLSTSSVDFQGFTFRGRNTAVDTMTVDTAALVQNCVFETLDIGGVLDGNSSIQHCTVENLNYVSGNVEGSKLNATITLAPATQADIINCESGVAGGGGTPTIDCGGSGSLTVRGFIGGLKITNVTGGGNISIDMTSGQLIIDSTCTGGTITARGNAKLVNNANGTSVNYSGLIDPTLSNTSLFIDGRVYVDTVNGANTTEYPSGSAIKPCLTLAQGLSIMSLNGLSAINLRGTCIGCTEDLSGVDILGGSGYGDLIQFAAGVNTDGSTFERLILCGPMAGLSRIDHCILGVEGFGQGLSEIEGRIENCIINSTYGVTQKTTGAGSLMDNCSFQFTNNVQIPFDANGKAFSLRNCTGNILVQNKTDSEDIQVNLLGGVIEFAPSCANGSVQMTGHATVVDNSAVGCDVNHDNLLHADKIHTELKETWQRLGLDSTNPITNNPDGSISSTDVNINAVDSAGSIIQTRA